MRERRSRAERAWDDTRECLALHAGAAGSARIGQLRQCSGAARDAAELALELPEHGSTQLEVQAALAELANALENGNEARSTVALDRISRAGGALRWRPAFPRLP